MNGQLTQKLTEFAAPLLIPLLGWIQKGVYLYVRWIPLVWRHVILLMLLLILARYTYRLVGRALGKLVEALYYLWAQLRVAIGLGRIRQINIERTRTWIDRYNRWTAVWQMRHQEITPATLKFGKRVINLAFVIALLLTLCPTGWLNWADDWQDLTTGWTYRIDLRALHLTETYDEPAGYVSEDDIQLMLGMFGYDKEATGENWWIRYLPVKEASQKWISVEGEFFETKRILFWFGDDEYTSILPDG